VFDGILTNSNHQHNGMEGTKKKYNIRNTELPIFKFYGNFKFTIYRKLRYVYNAMYLVSNKFVLKLEDGGTETQKHVAV
jgi:hypothetical protein